jgi:serine/threonine-protein kinase
VSDLLGRIKSSLADRYSIERELGRGGMAVVYLARDLKHNRSVALKVLRPELAASIGASRFLREIQIEAALQHPHILPLHDSGEAGGLLYYSMPFIEGESLREHLNREEQLTVEAAVAIASDVAQALHHAHEQGVVHRDIKPENILLSGDSALVADFGIASAIADAGGETLTESGIAIGTPAYMSPEQAGGKGVDRRSDIYALGCVLYEMLVGEPPFTGRTTQAIIARHMQERVPSIEVVRPGIPHHIVEVLEISLAKVPADRFATAMDFAGALHVTPSSIEVRVTRRAHVGKKVRGAAVGLFATVAITLGLWQLWIGRSPPLDATRVVVFPLEEVSVTRLPESVGDVVGQLIGSALENTHPLRWLDGRTWLGSRETTAPVADSIARERHAKYRLSGSVVEYGDSASVILRLQDVEGDSVVEQLTSSGLAHIDSVIRLGMHAVRGVLPALLEPGRTIDISAIADRDVSAVALWMQGQNEYRRSRFAEALGFYERAVERDSLLAMAAVMGAWAARWEHDTDRALALVNVALAHRDLLPPRYTQYAEGMHLQLSGMPDSAISSYRLALDQDPERVELLMSIAEVYHHFVLEGYAVDSATALFERATTVDPEFTPALIHLAERYLREGNTNRAEQLVAKLDSVGAKPDILARLKASLECVRDGADGMEWREWVRETSTPIVMAGTLLAASGAQLACAEEAYRATLESENSARSDRWGARLSLQSLLLAQGRYDEMAEVLDGAADDVRGSTEAMYLMNAIAGAPVDERAASVYAQRCSDPAQNNAPMLWLCGIFASQRGDPGHLERIETALQAKLDSAPSRRDSLINRSVSAFAALAVGDTATALQRFGSLKPTGNSGDLFWQPWEPLAAARITYARLLLARREFAEAHRVASAFDHPQPVIYLAFLPASLTVRIEAAEAMGEQSLAEVYRQRLAALQGGQ